MRKAGLEKRISRVEESRFGKSNALTMSTHWYSSDDDPSPCVVWATVFAPGRHALVSRENSEDDDDFWAEAESQHFQIHGRSASVGKRFDYRVYYEGKP